MNYINEKFSTAQLQLMFPVSDHYKHGVPFG